VHEASLEVDVARATPTLGDLASLVTPSPPFGINHLEDDPAGLQLAAGWGGQRDVRRIAADNGEELTEEQVAGYIAKYATKSTEAIGVTLDHRISAGDLEEMDVPAHVAELVRACFELAARPSLERLRLRKWAHMLGFGGHFSTKSRRYSTTLGALRRARSPTPSAGAVARRSPWTPGGARRTRRPSSWLPRGSTSVGATGLPGRRGWPPRQPPGLVKRGGSPRRN
jgi:hypothetical protein